MRAFVLTFERTWGSWSISTEHGVEWSISIDGGTQSLQVAGGLAVGWAGEMEKLGHGAKKLTD